MKKGVRFSNLSIWALVTLGQELEDIAMRLNHIGCQLTTMNLHAGVYEAGMDRIKFSRCRPGFLFRERDIPRNRE